MDLQIFTETAILAGAKKLPPAGAETSQIAAISGDACVFADFP
ncbi:MAG TPA: hypothetical protein VF096_08945 [Azonexus sp.]